MDYDPMPTVIPAEPLDVDGDTANLRAAMKGFGTDEQAIIDILTARTNAQRQAIKEHFLREFGRDLIEDLKSELGGKFEDVIVALMLPPVEYLCKQLHKAMAGIGTDESTLVEILCTKSNEEMAEIVKCYESMYDRPLAEQMCSETSGHFRRLLTLIVTGVRDQVGTVDEAKAKEQAEQLYNAGEAKLGTDEEVFNRILAHGSFAQLRLVFEEYKEMSGQTMEQAIKHEMSGEMHEAMMAIDTSDLRKAMKGLGTDEQALIDILTSVSNEQRQRLKNNFFCEYGRDLIDDLKSELSFRFEEVILSLMMPPVEYLCQQLHRAMAGWGTNETALIEILCSRSNSEMQEIVASYEEFYARPLAEHICSETSGDFRRLLTMLVAGLREPEHEVDVEETIEKAEQLFDAGQGKIGTDIEVFNRILSRASLGQLRLIFEEYKQLAGRTIEQTIRSEMSGNLKRAMLAIGEFFFVIITGRFE